MIIELTQGLVIEVDPDDYLFLINWKWNAKRDSTTRTGFYAGRSVTDKPLIRMHRSILINRGINIEGFQVDHKDGDSLNNKFSNLRRATPSQNSCNRPIPKNNKSGCKGVWWSNDVHMWRVAITINKRTINLGCFIDFETACEIRKEAEIKYHSYFRYTGKN